MPARPDFMFLTFSGRPDSNHWSGTLATGTLYGPGTLATGTLYGPWYYRGADGPPARRRRVMHQAGTAGRTESCADCLTEPQSLLPAEGWRPQGSVRDSEVSIRVITEAADTEHSERTASLGSRWAALGCARLRAAMS